MSGGDWGEMTLCRALDETARRFPDKEAIVFRDRRIPFRYLHENVRRLAKSFLRAGVKKGAKVAIMMTNLPEWIYARDAAIKVGAWWVPINTRYKTTELVSHAARAAQIAARGRACGRNLALDTAL